MKDELNRKLKSLRLNGWIQSWSRYQAMARESNHSFEAMLTLMVDEEYQLKQDRALRRRILKARIEEEWRMETFPFPSQPKLSKKKVLSVYDSLDYLHKPSNVIWIGPTGCGKTGLATAFLIHALELGHSGLFINFHELLHRLHQSVADHSEKKALKPFLQTELLLIDEIGYAEIGSSQAEPVQIGLFFELLSYRHRKAATLITTNLGFLDWPDFLKNKHLTAALLDRLTEDSYIFNMAGCHSLRNGAKVHHP